MSAALPLLTASRLKTARRCQREHRFAYGMRVRPAVQAEALRFGSLAHLGLEAWFRAHMRGDPAGALDAALAATAVEADPFARARAVAMLIGYDARWSAEMAGYEVIAVEVAFDAPLRNPQTRTASRTWRLGGKLDAIVRERSTGRILIVEHKTTTEDLGPGTVYWQRLKLDGQVSIYFHGASALGLEPAACLYDVLSVPGARPSQVPELDADGVKIVLDQAGERVRTKDGKRWRQTGDAAEGYTVKGRPETPDEYQARLIGLIAEDPAGHYARGEVVRLRAELDEALADVWQMGRMLRENDLAGIYPRNVDGCMRYGRPCPYLAVCVGEASITDPALYRVLDTDHPELAEAPAA